MVSVSPVHAPRPAAPARSLSVGRRVFVALLLLGGVGAAVALTLHGYAYYEMNLWERADHPELAHLGSSGATGLWYGIAGTVLILVNLTYLLRRHVRALRRAGSLRTWMELHILTGLLGPLLIAFHSTFLLKTQIAITASVALAVLVVTGLIGRYIYAQVPRTVSGAEAGPSALAERAAAAEQELARILGADSPFLVQVRALADRENPVPHNKVACLFLLPWISLRGLLLRAELGGLARRIVRETGKTSEHRHLLLELRDVVLIRQRLQALETFRELLRWWRGLHRTFAIVMVVAAAVHIGVATVLGYAA
jgi:hypothetical protein